MSDAPTTPADAAQPPVTRLIFFGDPAVADGFRLIGFETHPSPTPADVDHRLRELLREREPAFVVVDEALMAAPISALQQVRREGGRIVVVAVPALAGPPRLASEVADRLAAMFGQAAGRP